MEVAPKTNHSIMTRENFPINFELHIEFWVPKEPNKRDQARGNSGVYLHGRHEIQICDGFENPIAKPMTACGALFNEIAPSSNACTPPETWQTYDITYSSPRMNGQNQVTTPGRLTVIHNGTKIIDNATFAAIGSKGQQNNNIGQPGPLMLQGHGSPVRFRNIRIRPLKESDDLTRWQGRWRLVALHDQGGDATVDRLAELNQSMRIEGNRRFVERTIKGKVQPYSGTFRINPAASPKEFDFDFDGASAAGGQRGLYEFDGPRLRLIYRASNTEKPARPQWSDKGQPDVGWFEFEREEYNWTDLFNGKDLTGWKPVPLKSTKDPGRQRWAARSQEEILESLGEDHLDLETERKFRNFALQLEWRFTPGGKSIPNGSGVIVRSRGLTTAGPVAGFDPKGIEIDLRENSAAENKIGIGCFVAYGTPLENAGGKTDGVQDRHLDRLREPVLSSSNGWNTCEITCNGDRISVQMNGAKISEAWGAEDVAGSICLRNQKSAVQFRNIRIRELNQADASTLQK